MAALATEFSASDRTSAGSRYTVNVSFLSMISGLLVLLLPLELPGSERAWSGLKLDRGASGGSVLATVRPIGEGGVSEYLGILCLDTSGEVLGFGLEASRRPCWAFALSRSEEKEARLALW